MSYDHSKYKPYQRVELKDRKWPDQVIEYAPHWCSVDLRDGNQALATPMNVTDKLELYQLLLDIGFKEIEIGFPSASDTEYKFARKLIEDNLIPGDVRIQVLTQSRRALIEKTFESLKGAEKAIVHLYNSTSIAQRKMVFNMSKQEIIDIALRGTELVKELSLKNPDLDIMFQYSPESFTGTELDFALEICEAVSDIWEPTKDKPMILNLPATVEMSSPNIHADQIEWFLKHVKNRESIRLSVHTHNDRGCGVAAAELAMMAGADRVEGTLFGNGERTGNVDILTLGMNMYSQGVDPKLNFSDMNRIVNTYEKCTGMKVPPRHPYAGELVYTAFSGSHQDAIRKGFTYIKKEKPQFWEVPYLPIDPADLGREYEAIIRINSQSGKGGIAYIMEQEFGFKLPKAMHPEFGAVVQQISDEKGMELPAKAIFDAFKASYLELKTPLELIKYDIEEKEDLENPNASKVHVSATVSENGSKKSVAGSGNGPLDAFFNALQKGLGYNSVKFLSYDEHAIGEGSDTKAVTYIQLENQAKEQSFGVGISSNITTASLLALISSLNRLKTIK